MKQKLNAKDFILIGVLTALMWIICMIISTIMSVAGPVTNVFYPSVVAIPNLRRNSGYPVSAGGRFLVHSYRTGNWWYHLRFSGYEPE